MEIKSSWKDEYKTDFLLSLRNFELSKVILFCDDITTPIQNFVLSLLALEISIEHYEHYYWDIKNLITGYINYCDSVTREMLSMSLNIHSIDDKKEFIEHLSKIKYKQNNLQNQFIASLKYVKDNTGTPVDRCIKTFEEYMKKLDEIEAIVEKIDKSDPFLCSVQEQLDITVAWLEDLFEFSASHISKILCNIRKLIHSSLEENYKMQHNNVKKYQTEHSETLKCLQRDVYEGRKSWLHYSRSLGGKQREFEEIDRSIQKSLAKLQDFQSVNPINLEESKKTRDYFGRCLISFEEICKEINAAENVCQNIEDINERTLKLYAIKREKIIQDDSLGEIEKGAKLTCLDEKLDEFIEEYKLQSMDLHSHLNTAQKPLITFFFVKGNITCMHSDGNGEFYLNEYGKKIYSKNYGMDHYSVNSEVAIGKTQLPKIKGKLSREDVDYLWNSVGHFLPQALYAVAKVKPKNPIFYLAHRLISAKYGASEDKLNVDKEEATQYNEKIIAKRQESKIRAYEQWKSLQMKSPAPKDFDDEHNHNIIYYNIMQQCLQSLISSDQ